MTEPVISEGQKQESAYREFFKQEGNCIITLGDLFEAVEQTPEIAVEVNRIFAKYEPIRILIEWSAFEQNIDVLDRVISKRNNPNDSILLVDVSESATKEHSDHIQKSFSNRKYRVIRGDMNNLPLPSNSIDLVINDCAVNFNTSDELNTRTLSEIKRLLKPANSACLFSVAVDRQYDGLKFGQNQELVPPDKVDIPGFFYPLPDQNFTRICWPVPHYKSLICTQGFQFTEFDIQKGKTHFPEPTKISYRRYLLKSSV